MRRWRLSLVVVVALLAFAPESSANTTPQTLPFSQGWSNIGLITTDDDWSGPPGVVGYRGDGLTGGVGTDPQTVVGEGTPVVDVNANEANPTTNSTGGTAEFELANPVVALQGSGTADAPHLVLHVDTTGAAGIRVSYNLRDIDGSADDAVQQVAVQYRVGSAGDFTNVPAGYVADATTVGAATQVTPVSALLPAAADNKPLVQVRIITTNAVGNDEWVGVDDIAVGTGPTAVIVRSFAATRTEAGGLLRWRTGPETRILGFDVYREVSGRRVRVNRSLIRPAFAAREGRSYLFLDRAAPRGAVYRLQVVGLDGSRTWQRSARLR